MGLKVSGYERNLLVYVAVKVGLTDVTTRAMKRDSWNKMQAR